MTMLLLVVLVYSLSSSMQTYALYSSLVLLYLAIYHLYCMHEDSIIQWWFLL